MSRTHLIITLVLAVAAMAACGRAATTNSAGVLAARPAETNEWSMRNLATGPIEMGGGAVLPMIGMLAGGIIGAEVPLEYMEPGCAALAPYGAVAGATVGTVAFALLSPVVIIEGLFDTFTGGLCAARPFAWFNVKVPMDSGDLLGEPEMNGGAKDKKAPAAR